MGITRRRKEIIKRLLMEKKPDHDALCRAQDNGQYVLLYQTRFRMSSGTLFTKWEGPYEVQAQQPNGAVEIKDLKSGKIFKVNGQRLKAYHGHNQEDKGVNHRTPYEEET